MPKIVDKEKMQEKILEAGLLAFLKHGFNNTSMIKIAKEAGIAKGTLYLYFDSKEALTQTITNRFFDEMKIRLIAIESFRTVDMLMEHVKKALLISEEESEFIPIFFEAFGSSFRSEAFIANYRDFFEEVGEFYAKSFQVLIDNGEIDSSINTVALGRVFVSMLDGIVLHKGFFKMSGDVYESMVDESLGLFRRGLKMNMEANK
ncbi:MAG TPA: TetR/AcrR family transcriptional regulator [Campylobacterales bacterium]|nr:TetR/AcrR family transcriptional regulator [Campylobacterales bacterium]